MGLPLALAAALLAPAADCEQSAIGPTPVPSSADVRFGKLRMIDGRYLEDEPRRKFRADEDSRYRGMKVAIALRGDRPARLRVAKADREDARLMYGQPAPDGGRYRISQGRVAERFIPCEERDVTVWTGYVFSRGPRCVALGGRVGHGAWVRRRLAFGRNTCAEPR
jgi:hypothetical protein